MPDLADPTPMPDIGFGAAPGCAHPTGPKANPLNDQTNVADPKMAPLIGANPGTPVAANRDAAKNYTKVQDRLGEDLGKLGSVGRPEVVA